MTLCSSSSCDLIRFFVGLFVTGTLTVPSFAENSENRHATTTVAIALPLVLHHIYLQRGNESTKRRPDFWQRHR